jgi:hypothetical protein
LIHVHYSVHFILCCLMGLQDYWVSSESWHCCKQSPLMHSDTLYVFVTL